MATRGTTESPRGNNRGRGGHQTARQRPPPATAGETKIGPTTVGTYIYKKDPAVAESFIVVIGDGSMDSFTIHKPIGETDLPKTAWVCTPTSEVQTLVSRIHPEGWKELCKQREAHVAELVLAAGIGRKIKDGQEVFATSGKVYKEVSRLLQVKAKEQGVAINEWHTLLTESDKSDYEAYKKALKTEAYLKVAEEKFPSPHHRTCGGPLEDRPQAAVPHLEGLTLTQAKQLTLLRLFRNVNGKDKA